ncbi:MAG: hypothetical protein ACOYEV_11740 [Candidatus Nanopelagicales bacterium]
MHGHLPGGFLDRYDAIHTVAYREADLRSLHSDVSVKTFRFFMNERIAQILGVAYNCTSLSVPAERVALQGRSEYGQEADELLSRSFPG